MSERRYQPVSSRWKGVLPILAIVVVGGAYLIAIWGHRAPIVFADEQGYLGNARWLVGGPHWSMDSAGFIPIGYPLVLTPIFRFVHQPELIYREVLALNALLCALLAGVLYVLARRPLRIGRRGSVALVFVACSFPAIVVHSVIAWTEILAMAGVAVLVSTAWRAVTRPQLSTFLAHTSIIVYLTSVHARFILLAPLTLAYWLYVAVRHKDLRRAAGAAIALLVIGWWIVRRLQDAVLRARWDRTVQSAPLSIGDVI